MELDRAASHGRFLFLKSRQCCAAMNSALHPFFRRDLVEIEFGVEKCIKIHI